MYRQTIGQRLSNSQAKHGFSLIEAAIVLAVVGLVIGGIWVATNAVRLNMQTNELRQDVLKIGTSFWNMFRGVSIPAMTSLGAIVANGGIMPGSWKWNGIDSPLGTVFTSASGIRWQMYAEFSNRPKLWTEVGDDAGNMPSAVCTRLSSFFYPAPEALIVASPAERTLMVEAVKQKTGGIVLSGMPDCSNGAEFRLDFYRMGR